MSTFKLMQKKSLTAILVLGITLFAITAQADPINGDFASNGLGWGVSADPGLGATFPNTGGNPDGYAHLESDFDNQGGRVCISQTFMCGEPDQGTECTIGFDFKFGPVDAAPGTGRLIVIIDGISVVVADQDTQGWDFISFVVPCGEHTIEICMEIDPVNNSWEACIDNVQSECTGSVADEELHWDGIKSLYR